MVGLSVLLSTKENCNSYGMTRFEFPVEFPKTFDLARLFRLRDSGFPERRPGASQCDAEGRSDGVITKGGRRRFFYLQLQNTAFDLAFLLICITKFEASL